MSNIFPELDDRLSGVFPEILSAKHNVKSSGNTVSIHAIRHSSTDIDDSNSTHGWIDSPLNEKGKEDAYRLGKVFKGVPINKVFSSDLKRARQSSYFVSAVTGVHPEPKFDLRPIDMGKLSGKKHQDNFETMKELYEKWKTDPDTKIPGGESFSDFQNRNMGMLRSIIEGSKPGDNIAIVGHSITSRLLQSLSKKGSLDALAGSEITPIAKNEQAPMLSHFEYSPETGKFK